MNKDNEAKKQKNGNIDDLKYAHEYHWMVDNGVVADPIMKAWLLLDNMIVDRGLAPLLNGCPAEIETIVRAVNQEYTGIRKAMFKMLDALNDPVYCRAERDLSTSDRMMNNQGIIGHLSSL